MGMSQTLLVFGMGYSAEVLAARLKRLRWRIIGTSRSEDGCRAGSARGYEMHRFDRSSPVPQDVIDDADHVLVSVPPDEAGDPVVALHGEDLARLPKRWVGYLSTTGVYGDHGGAWVDEDTAITPQLARADRRARAEAAWLDLFARHDVPVHLFRLAGIYGPGRNVFESVRAGRAQRIDKPGQVFSRIHVDDIATVLEASIAAPNPGRVYNVCDDEPSAPEAVVAYACSLLGLEPPPLIPFAAARLSEMGRSFYADNKRVRNSRIKAELGVRLCYPTYREGLRALADAEIASISPSNVAASRARSGARDNR